MVTVTEPVTTVRLDTPAGLVLAEVRVSDGVLIAVTIRNVASFAVGLDRRSRSPDTAGPLRPGLRGNFYAIPPLADYDLPF